MCGTEPALEAVIDYEVGLFDKSEIAGAYRSVCAMLLLRTATVVKKPTRFRNEETLQKKTARRWVEHGDEGVITFREACAAIDADPEQMRADILARVRSDYPPPATPQYVFGRKGNETGRKTATAN